MLDLTTVNWRKDRITREFIVNHKDILEHPETMEPHKLGEAITYCENINNPFSEELLSRSGHLDAYRKARTWKKRSEILDKSCRYHGLMLG